MMNLRKKTLGLALTAAMVGGGASLAQAQAVVDPGSLGQVLIYPYFVAQSGENGWSSFMHVINTSNNAVAAKVRFRRATDSVDAYDFILMLSPNDMWTAAIEVRDGKVGFRPTDTTCTVPKIGVNVFQPMADGTPSELYAEVMLMGVSGTPNALGAKPLQAAATHVNGVPANCGAIVNAFSGDAANLAAQGAEFEFDLNSAVNAALTNVLTGKYDLVNVGLGQSGAGRAVALANVGAPDFPGAPTDTTVLGPVFANTNVWTQQIGSLDVDHPNLSDGAGGLDAANSALMKTKLINEWVLNPNLNELSSWIVTFPTKKLYNDAIGQINASVDQTPKLPLFGTTVPAGNCVQPVASIYNREEAPLSIGSGTAYQLCYEANVINFKSGVRNSATVLNSQVAIAYDLSQYTTGLAGWMRLAFDSATTAPLQTGLTQVTLPSVWLPGVDPIIPVARVAGPAGRPAVGFNLTARSIPADAVLYDHAYTVPAVVTGGGG